MSAPLDRDELLSMIAAYADCVATAEQLEELEQRLRSDPAARQLYFDYVDLNLDLRQQQIHQQSAGEPAALFALGDGAALGVGKFARAAGGARAPWFQRPVYFWSLVTVMTLLIWAAILGWTSPWWWNSREVATQGPRPLVASLVETVGAVWDEQSIAWLPGTRLAAGRELRLKSGLAQVVFDSGAAIILEGPCHFEVETSGAAKLHRGKLTANVPAEAVGFAVQAKSAKIVDLGTEFGVNVAADGAAEVAVFEGAVQLELLDAGGRPTRGASQRIEAGSAVRVAFAAGETSPWDGAADGFVREMPGQAPLTIGYWRFEGERDDFLADASGNGLTLHGMGKFTPYAWPVSDEPASEPRVVLQTGAANASAADLGVRAGHFEVPFHPALAPASFTLEALVRHEAAAPPWGYFIASRWETVSPSNQRSWSLGVGGTGEVFAGGPKFDQGELFMGLSLDGTIVNSVYLGSGLVVQPDKDHYVAVCYERPKGYKLGKITFWMQNLTDNGPLLSKTVETHIAIFRAPAGPLRIGRINGDQQRWAGLIDEVRYSNFALEKHQLLISSSESK